MYKTEKNLALSFKSSRIVTYYLKKSGKLTKNGKYRDLGPFINGVLETFFLETETTGDYQLDTLITQLIVLNAEYNAMQRKMDSITQEISRVKLEKKAQKEQKKDNKVKNIGWSP